MGSRCGVSDEEDGSTRPYMRPHGFASFQYGDNCVACCAVAANLKRRSRRWYIQDETELVFPLRKRTFLRKLSYDELGYHTFTFFSPIEPFALCY